MDTIYQNEELVTQRLSCGCLYPGHILDVSLETIGVEKEVTLCLYMDGKAPLKYRLKQVWKLLWGEEGQLADFILRREDVPELIGLLSRAVTNPMTAGTYIEAHVSKS